MKALWQELAPAHPSLECGPLLGRPEIGFGLLVPARPMRLDEGSAWRRGIWAVRRAISSRLSYRLKRRLGSALDRLSPRIHRHLDPS
jgi:hypothetical protein